MDVIDLTGRMRYRLGHGDYDLPPTGGGLYGMIEFAAQDIKEAKNLFRHIQIALFESMPSDSITIKDWFVEHTHNTGIINLFQGFCAALMGTNLHEVPAGEFFRFLKYSSKGSRFGMATKGNGSLVDDLAVAIESMGSEVRRRARCTRILVDDGVLNGVEIHNSGGGIEIVKTDIVLSNSGPDLTVALAGGETKFDQEYLKKLHANSADAPIMHVSFVMDEPLVEDFAGCMVFCNTLNLIYLEIPSAILSNYSPEGKYLHVAYGAPADAANPNLDKELQNTIDELEINVPGISARAEFLVKAKHRGSSPGMRRWAGFGMPVSTSIKGLYNIGDG
jgi:phytoene dehydrogenase-like protein